MRTLHVDNRWGMECVGYHAQARPNTGTIAAIQTLQKDVTRRSPVPLHLIPASALHISVFTFLPAGPPSDRVDRAWREIHSALTSQGGCDLSQTAMSILFQRIAFTEKAIILLTSEQPAVYVQMRTQFRTILESLNLDAPSYDQTHLTIARYAESGTIDDCAVAPIEEGAVDFLASFETVQLCRERLFPSLTADRL